ncbi:MAG: hypothetical protein AAFR87_20075 [Bacteroidota bacterium]
MRFSIWGGAFFYSNAYLSSNSMKLERLVRLQFIYCLLGILFNVISLYLLSQGNKALTPTEPLAGIVVMSIYGLFLLSGKMRQIRLYRVLMGLAVAIFIYSGIIKHMISLSQSPEVYFSIGSGVLAIAINLFGLILNLRAAMGRFS